MSHEITDTTNMYDLPRIPEGRRNFMVSGPVKKIYGKKGSECFVWPVEYKDDSGKNLFGEQLLLPNMMGGLLRVLGNQETEPNKFDWNTTEQEGKTFIATVKYAPDKQDPSISRTHMGEFAKGEVYEDPGIGF